MKSWYNCKFLTCSILPVRIACNLQCRFCFSKSSISRLREDTFQLSDKDLHYYYQYAVDRGAKRLVITGGGEPLLKPNLVLRLVRIGHEYFSEIACFTNGSYLTEKLSDQLLTAGLSYICYSRHHQDDHQCQQIMGKGVSSLGAFFKRVGALKVRATCVMCQGYIDNLEKALNYIKHLNTYGVTEYTFKHTYVAYSQSVYQFSNENQWAQNHKIQQDPFIGVGMVLGQLPWGPQIRQIGEAKVCYYHEPTPEWEIQHLLCRSINLLSNGKAYASLENQQSRLFTLHS